MKGRSLMRFQLCMSDEYGQMSILQSGTNVAALVERAKKEVNAANVENSLSAGEKKRNWEAMYVELTDPVTGELVEDAYYGGKDNTGQFAVTPLVGAQKLVKMASCDVKPRLYLGYLDREDWYAETERGAQINDLKHASTQGKTTYFIRRID